MPYFSLQPVSQILTGCRQHSGTVIWCKCEAFQPFEAACWEWVIDTIFVAAQRTFGGILSLSLVPQFLALAPHVLLFLALMPLVPFFLTLVSPASASGSNAELCDMVTERLIPSLQPKTAVDIDHPLIVQALQHNPAKFDVPVMICLASRSVKKANLYLYKQGIRTGRGAVCDGNAHVRFWDQSAGATEATK